jgi:hypothetical protein
MSGPRASGRRRKYYKFADLEREHQWEVAGQLGRRLAARTVWELHPRFPTEGAAAIAWDASVTVSERRVREVKLALEAGGSLRPILIDALDENREPWIEGIHRSIAASELGLETIPALLRVE